MAPASPNFFVHGRGLTASTARKGAPRILEALATHLARLHVLTSPFSVLIVGRRLQRHEMLHQLSLKCQWQRAEAWVSLSAKEP